MQKLRNFRNKKIILSIFFLLVLIFFCKNLYYSNSCKQNSMRVILNSIKSFGVEHYLHCYSKNNLKNNLKKILSKNVTIYNFFANKKNSSNWFLPFNESDLSYVKEQIIKEKNVIKPFIKGITEPNNNLIDNFNLVDLNNKEYTTWTRSHGGNSNTHYDSNKFLNKNNIKRLKLEWIYESVSNNEINKKWKQHIEINPVFLNNKLIVVTADWKIVCLNPINGKVIWEKQTLHSPSRRGILTEHDLKSNSYFLYLPIKGRLYKINLDDGKLIKDFGKSGYIPISTITAPMIYGKNLIVSTTQAVFSFNKYNGKKKNKVIFHPKRKFLGGSGSAWGGVALDEKKGLVYVVTGNPRPGSYGVKRKGDNRNTNSIIAIDLKKNEIAWTFQETKHDLWDYDISSPPIIYDLRINQKIYEVVIVVTKIGHTLILERNTGKPIYDVNYIEVPKSKMSGEYASKFQMDLKVPEKFSDIQFKLKDISELSNKKKKEISKFLDNSIYGKYEPPQLGKNLILFGVHGGAQWMGAALDPIKQNLYIPVNNDPWVIRPEIISTESITFFPNKLKKIHKSYLNKCSSCHGKRRNAINKNYKDANFKYIPGLVGFNVFPELKFKMNNLKKFNDQHPNLILSKKELIKFNELFNWWDKKLLRNSQIKIEADTLAWSRFVTKDNNLATNPPWGYVAKVNLPTGKILWKSPIGNAFYKGQNMLVGTEIFGGVALNGGNILFVNGTADKKAYAIDANDGKVLWSYEMDAVGSAPPVIFNIKNKQYVSFVSTGGKALLYKEKGSKIYTFSIN